MWRFRRTSEKGKSFIKEKVRTILIKFHNKDDLTKYLFKVNDDKVELIDNWNIR